MSEQPVNPRIWWRTQSNGTAVTIRSACIVPDSVQAESRLAEAEAWLRRNLANHGIPSKLIIEQAANAGIAEKTLRRAFKQLGGHCYKAKFDGGWVWELPVFSEDGQASLDGDSGAPGATHEDGQSA